MRSMETEVNRMVRATKEMHANVSLVRALLQDALAAKLVEHSERRLDCHQSGIAIWISIKENNSHSETLLLNFHRELRPKKSDT